MHDKHYCHIFLSMSPEPWALSTSRCGTEAIIYSTSILFSTILSLYFVKSQLRCHHCCYNCLSWTWIVNFSKSRSHEHETPHQLHTHSYDWGTISSSYSYGSRSNSYVYKDFQRLLQWQVVIRMQPHPDICLVHSHRWHQWENHLVSHLYHAVGYD